jgi:hypothetical protein
MLEAAALFGPLALLCVFMHKLALPFTVFFLVKVAVHPLLLWTTTPNRCIVVVPRVNCLKWALLARQLVEQASKPKENVGC